MNGVGHITPAVVLAAGLALLPLLAAAFFPHQITDQHAAQPSTLSTKLPTWLHLLPPAVLCVPYILVTTSTHTFHWTHWTGWAWLTLYALLPVAVATLLHQARQLDPDHCETPDQMDPGTDQGAKPKTGHATGQGVDHGTNQRDDQRTEHEAEPALERAAHHRPARGNWLDFLVLATLGLAVDLRWFESAWPPGFSVFNKILLLDAGIYGFLAIRQLTGVGFDLRLRLRDLTTALREFALYAPLAIALGLVLGFLHVHHAWPAPLHLAGTFLFTFFLIAIPEELFFRGWIQNLLERRVGRYPALILTAILFGLSHFNKRAAHFNWRYVLLATIAGLFYGRAWRQDRRVGASAITHACVDTVWSAWLR